MMHRLFPYYGAKHSCAHMYPAPRFGHIVEPFAGSAAYSHLWGADNDVTLIEKNPRVASIWEWLISVSEDELMALPGVDTFEHIDETGWPEGPAREFLRQWCADAASGVTSRPTSMTKQRADKGLFGFFEHSKSRISDNLRHIRHWRVENCDYRKAPDCAATWFIDPPYTRGGEHYPGTGCNTRALDFNALGEWCKARSGDVIVCEGDGADWLPFSVLKMCPPKPASTARVRGTVRRAEMVWYRRDGATIESWNVGSFRAPGQETLF